MGRAVGGASAAGCGAFSLAGLVVSIGLVFWLGSQALSGSTDSIATSSTTVVPVTMPAGAALTVPDGLGAEGTVRVTGGSLPPGPIHLRWCLAVDDAGAAAQCDDAATAPATVPPSGQLSVDVPIHRVLRIDGSAYDCAASAGACSLVGRPAAGAAGAAVAADLVFATGLPQVDAVAPPSS